MYLSITIIALALIASVQGECDGGCNLPIEHYKEVGCEAVYAKPGDCCPTHFDCGALAGRPADKCYYKGKEYEIREPVPTELTVANCAAACTCAKNDWADFDCIMIECPEKLDPPPSDCVLQYELGQCCAANIYCPPLDDLVKCEVEGKSFYEGEWFSAPPSAGRCITCVCKPGFEGKYEEPFCRKVNCGVELSGGVKFRANCAPTFYGNDRCCPIDWQCPKEGDTIIPGNNPESEEKCKYGEKELNIGDKVALNNRPAIDCECLIPPLVTCIQKKH